VLPFWNTDFLELPAAITVLVPGCSSGLGARSADLPRARVRARARLRNLFGLPGSCLPTCLQCFRSPLPGSPVLFVSPPPLTCVHSQILHRSPPVSGSYRHLPAGCSTEFLPFWVPAAGATVLILIYHFDSTIHFIRSHSTTICPVPRSIPTTFILGDSFYYRWRPTFYVLIPECFGRREFHCSVRSAVRYLPPPASTGVGALGDRHLPPAFWKAYHHCSFILPDTILPILGTPPLPLMTVADSSRGVLTILGRLPTCLPAMPFDTVTCRSACLHTVTRRHFYR